MNDEQFKAVSRPEQVYLESFITGDVSRAIENQEKQGQRALIQSRNLPRQTPRWMEFTTEQLYAAWGIEILHEVDDLFYAVKLLERWEIKGTDHSMWTRLLDEQQRDRAGIFYKAAFYDRKAHISPNNRYIATTDYKSANSACIMLVRDTATGETLYVAGRVPSGEQEHWEEQDRLEKAAKEWLNEHYPDNNNPLAYW